MGPSFESLFFFVVGSRLYLFLFASLVSFSTGTGDGGVHLPWTCPNPPPPPHTRHIPLNSSWIQLPLRWQDCNSSPLFWTAFWFAQGCDVVSVSFQGWVHIQSVKATEKQCRGLLQKYVRPIFFLSVSTWFEHLRVTWGNKMSIFPSRRLVVQ